jgi:hypothetical protein
MGKRPYYTSTELIEAVQRKISMPIAQIAFTEDDILLFANEEMFLSQVPSILQFHEEYLVYPQSIPLESDVSRYDLPNRAIGMKLRDLFYQNTSGDLKQMAQILAGNADMYNGSGSTPHGFYLESDEIVLVPAIRGSVSGSLLAKYYLRPNSLVLNARAAICNAFVKIITVTNASMVNGDTLTIGSLVLTAGTSFTIGASSTATATNIANAVTGDLSATATTGTLSVVFDDTDILFSTTSAGLSISTQTGIQCDSIPEHFTDGMLVDFLQTQGGHRTYSFDVEIPTDGVTSNAVYFEDSVIPNKFIVGDYLCEQNECIIPQIPSDLHNLLAERTCCRVLEALGDIEGVASSNAKITDLEQRQAVLIDNRVEGAPRKIINRHSLLRTNSRYRRF